MARKPVLAILKLALAILGASAAATLALNVLALFSSQESGWNLLYFGAYPIIAGVTAMIGLPWHAAAVTFKLVGLSAYALAGAALGGLLVLLLWTPIAISYHAQNLAASLGVGFLSGAFPGAVAATAAWLILRPDRDANPPTKAQ